jgi:hypothetical protein
VKPVLGIQGNNNMKQNEMFMIIENTATNNFTEMEKFYEQRTNKHIGLVRKYCGKVPDTTGEYYHFLQERAENHDKSKFKEPEKNPYIYITWQYKCKDEGKQFDIPQNIKDAMAEATLHHVKTNKHHPEYWSSKNVGLLNRENRDEPPKEIVDATSMPDIDITEMVADWCAMSEEKGNSPIDWAKKNINIRWKFTDKQAALIYKLIKEIW